MPTKKRKKPSRSASKRPKLQKKAVQKKTAKRKITPKKKPAKKKTAVKKAASRTKAPRRKTKVGEPPITVVTRVQGTNQSVDTIPFPVAKQRKKRGGQSGDLQGLSGLEGADSESVAELIEEGNVFEAEAVAGVQEAGNSAKEVHTHEVSEDDVPGEYLDEQ